MLTITEQYEYSDPLKDQTRPVAIRLKTAKSGRRLFFGSSLFRKISSSRIIKAGFYLNAYDRGITCVRFETSFSLFTIVQFMFAQDIISGWRYLTKGIKKLIFMSEITLVSTIFQDMRVHNRFGGMRDLANFWWRYSGWELKTGAGSGKFN